MNKNENAIHQHLWDTEKSISRLLIAWNSFRKGETSQINNIDFCLNLKQRRANCTPTKETKGKNKDRNQWNWIGKIVELVKSPSY